MITKLLAAALQDELDMRGMRLQRVECEQIMEAVINRTVSAAEDLPARPGPELHKPPRFTEDNCPGHVASDHDPKVCARCGIHSDSLRPPEDDE